jgi:AcrR family transcriptional regulator
MGRPHFASADFLGAARVLAAEGGPAAVTVGAVSARLRAPVGSFYHRFASRDLLLGALWLEIVLAFQQGLFAAMDRHDGLAAALHTPAWVRQNLDDARLLLLYSRHDFVQGEWPAALREGVADQAQRFEAHLARFARRTFRSARPDALRRAQFVLAEVPIAAVKPHLQRREPPPALVDELIRLTYAAVAEEYRKI